jgi:hypothetical protein
MLANLTLERVVFTAESTLGTLFINNDFFCYTLEDADRGLDQGMSIAEIHANKKYGKTAIPTGLYTFAMEYSPKFKRIMPTVKDVKGFTGIRMHPGNTEEDTMGCILVGSWYGPNNVKDSSTTFDELVAELYKYDDMSLEILKQE